MKTSLDSYSSLFIFKDLSCFLPAAAFLVALPLHVALFKFLQKAVGPSQPGQNLLGLPAVQENWG